MGDDRHKKESLGGVRVPAERKRQAQEKAAKEGKTLTEIVDNCLEKYIKKG
ncbi:hypothetical protein [Actinomadura sp. KC06]|uniref:hypothetical protein n=1 Tax=Actinomadura sp. KC06 TaxID=2530369 RepID=UPI00140452F0|nr:hypothetical protein [Actinomadura sp. KC06]